MFTKTQQNALNALVQEHTDEVIARTLRYYFNSGIWTDMLTDEDSEQLYTRFTQAAVDELGDMWAVTEALESCFGYELQGIALIHDLTYGEVIFDDVEAALKYIAKQANMQLA
jgi:hypothetical protein